MKLNAISKYGTLLTCVVLVVVGFLAWLIKYPETVSTQAKLTGTNAPKPIIVKQNGRLTALLTKNNQEVKQGELIGVLETTANYEEVLQLEQTIATIELDLQNYNIAAVKIAMQKNYNQLGELQGDYQSFMQAYIPYRDYVLGDYVSKKKQLLQKDINIAQVSKSILNEQNSLQQKDLRLSQTTIEKNKKLLEEKLISEQEYRELSSQYIGKQMTEPQMKSSYVSNSAQINNINKELVELDNQIITQKSLFEQAVLQIKNRIEVWKQNYLLTANSTGKLIFTTFLQENQTLAAGKVIAHIQPPKSSIYMETLVPQSNFGKVEVGQKVILKFDAYPWQEYGTVVGKIDYINPLPSDSGYYLAKIMLPNKLETNYKKEIPFVEGLRAQSEIVTKDIRLAESLYYELIKTIKK